MCACTYAVCVHKCPRASLARLEDDCTRALTTKCACVRACVCICVLVRLCLKPRDGLDVPDVSARESNRKCACVCACHLRMTWMRLMTPLAHDVTHNFAHGILPPCTRCSTCVYF